MKNNSYINNIFISSFIFYFTSILLFDLQSLLFSNPVDAACKWDCYWYSDIVNHGYRTKTYLFNSQKGKAAWPFFPLFPTLTYIIKYILNLSAEFSGLLLNQFLFFFVIMISFVYYKKFINQKSSFIFLFIISLSPFSLWYKIQYTECLYGLLSVYILYCTRKKYYNLLFLLSFLISLTRPTGVLLVAVCCLYLAIEKFKNKNTKNAFDCIFPLALASLGVSSYILFLHYRMGDGLAFSHMQYAWGRYFRLPGVWFFESIIHHKKMNGVISAILDMCFLYYGFKNKMILETSILAVTFFVAFCSGVESLHRYVMGSPIFAMILSNILDKKSINTQRISIFFLLVTNIIITFMWFNGSKYFF